MYWAPPRPVCPRNADFPADLQVLQGDLVRLAMDVFFEWEIDRGEQVGVRRMEEWGSLIKRLGPARIIVRLYEAVNVVSNVAKRKDDLKRSNHQAHV